jgi:hypothetical protein
MSLWGNIDTSNNAPIYWAASGYAPNVSANIHVSANSSNSANAQIAGIYGNTTIGFWREDVVSSIFGVDALEANSQLSIGDGRIATHAGWVHRQHGTGPIESITANAASVAVNSFITFAGGSVGSPSGMTGNTAANVRISVNTAGYITSIAVNAGGSYANTPVISGAATGVANVYTGLTYAENTAPISTSSFTNAVFTIVMGGRANRVNQETLVAMGSMTDDATDDAVYPDA